MGSRCSFGKGGVCRKLNKEFQDQLRVLRFAPNIHGTTFCLDRIAQMALLGMLVVQLPTSGQLRPTIGAPQLRISV